MGSGPKTPRKTNNNNNNNIINPPQGLPLVKQGLSAGLVARHDGKSRWDPSHLFYAVSEFSPESYCDGPRVMVPGRGVSTNPDQEPLVLGRGRCPCGLGYRLCSRAGSWLSSSHRRVGRGGGGGLG